MHDNPSSAEAIYAAKEDIVVAAQNFNRVNRAALKRIGRLMIAVAEDVSVDDQPAELETIQPRFMNPSIPSIASQTDALVKQAQAVPAFAGTRVFWEQLGYDESQVQRIMSDMRRSEARTGAMALLESKKEEDADADHVARDRSLSSS